MQGNEQDQPLFLQPQRFEDGGQSVALQQSYQQPQHHQQQHQQQYAQQGGQQSGSLQQNLPASSAGLAPHQQQSLLKSLDLQKRKVTTTFQIVNEASTNILGPFTVPSAEIFSINKRYEYYFDLEFTFNFEKK